MNFVFSVSRCQPLSAYFKGTLIQIEAFWLFWAFFRVSGQILTYLGANIRFIALIRAQVLAKYLDYFVSMSFWVHFKWSFWSRILFQRVKQYLL